MTLSCAPSWATAWRSVEGEDGLDVPGPADERLGHVGEGKPARDQSAQPARQTPLRDLEVAGAGLEMAPAGVDGAEHDAVAEDHVPVPGGDVHLDRLRAAGHAGKDAHAVRREDLHGREDDGGGA